MFFSKNDNDIKIKISANNDNQMASTISVQTITDGY